MIELIVAIALVGLVLWVIETLIPMNAQVKRLLEVVVVVILVLWVLQFFGLWTGSRLRFR